MKRIIINGTVVNSDSQFRADVLVDGETIQAIGTDLPRDDAEVLDAQGAYVIPGGVDVHTHCEMPFGGTVTCELF